MYVSGAGSAHADEYHEPAATFGSHGSAAGELALAGGAAPSEITVNYATEDLYVADTANHRVAEFTPRGLWVRAFGENVNAGAGEHSVCTTSCQAGISSSKPGGFEAPEFIAVDNTCFLQGREAGHSLSESECNTLDPSSGDVYVGDADDGVVSKYSVEGRLITTWGAGGQLKLPASGGALAGLAVGEDGQLFVLETNARVFWFNQDGTPRGQFFAGITGVSPFGLVATPRNALYKLLQGQANEFGTDGQSGESEIGDLNGGVSLSRDPLTGDLYIVEAGGVQPAEVKRFHVPCGRPCIESEAFAIGELPDPGAVAAGVGEHDPVYVTASTAESHIALYELVSVPPPVVTGVNIGAVSYTTAQVSGTVNPEGHETTCRFEYVPMAQFTDNGFAEALSTPCTTVPGSGTAPVHVEALLSGLKASTEYVVELTAENPGNPGNTEHSGPSTFTTLFVAPPTVRSLPVKEVGSTSALFAGEIEPNAPSGNPAAFNVSWHFECKPACPEVPGGEVPADSTSHEVSAKAAGLQPGTRYEVTLVGENAGGEGHAATTFRTNPVAPAVTDTFVSSAEASSAALSAKVDPGGAPTTYRFEYITNREYEADGDQFGEGAVKSAESEPLGPQGEDNSEETVMATFAGLSMSTDYRYRVVASNEVAGEVDGPSESFFTYASPAFGGCENEGLRIENLSLALPDCRAYERVSPAGDAEAFVPFGQENEAGDAVSERPMQSAPDGEQLVYVSEPTSASEATGTGNAGSGEGDEISATREAGGWSVSDIQPFGSSAETNFMAFSEDLSAGLISGTFGERLSPSAETDCPLLYSFSRPRSYTPLFSAEAPGECASHRPPIFAGASADYAETVFESKAALVEGATSVSGNGSGANLGEDNLYASSGGQLALVSVLPGSGAQAAHAASVGSLGEEPDILAGGGLELPPIDASGAVSADGTRIFWTDLETGIVYARENPMAAQSALDGSGACSEPAMGCTVQVSAGSATYWTATPDGRFAYYTEAGTLWRFDSDSGAREQLAGVGAGVQGVVGVNETGADGEYLYFVAAGALAPGAEGRKCEAANAEGSTPERREATEEGEGTAPVGRGCNLYVLHGGQMTLAAVLLPGDDEFRGNIFGTPQPQKGDWRPVLGYHSAELSPSGEALVFMSSRRLTSYDNRNTQSMCGNGERACSEVYVYDPHSEKLACASCSPSGVRPSETDLNGESTYLPGDFGSVTHTRRWISTDGDRVFFNTNQPLVPTDTNQAQDVYEWEREGTGSCVAGAAANGGCLYLLSGGQFTRGSFLIDASASGDDVFFTSRAQLTPGDGDEKPDVYDDRVEGGFPPILETAPCGSLEPCLHGPASKLEPPEQSLRSGLPSSGNLVPAPPPPPPPPPPPNGKQKLEKALKLCHQKHNRQKRKTCEKQARKRYGGAKSKKGATHRKVHKAARHTNRKTQKK